MVPLIQWISSVLFFLAIDHDLPILLGNIASLSMLLWTQAIKCSMYSGAGIFVGRLKFSESCQRYSNLFPHKPLT